VTTFCIDTGKLLLASGGAVRKNCRPEGLFRGKIEKIGNALEFPAFSPQVGEAFEMTSSFTPSKFSHAKQEI